MKINKNKCSFGIPDFAANSRGASGDPPDAPENPKRASGDSRDAFIERRRRAVVPKKLPKRFPDDFGSPRGRPTLDLTAPCQCFVSGRRFSSRRASDSKKKRKWSVLATRIEPDQPTQSFRRPSKGQNERRIFEHFEVSANEWGRAQKGRFGGAVRASKPRGPRRPSWYYL